MSLLLLLDSHIHRIAELNLPKKIITFFLGKNPRMNYVSTIPEAQFIAQIPGMIISGNIPYMEFTAGRNYIDFEVL
jgi:hypothetical protein